MRFVALAVVLVLGCRPSAAGLLDDTNKLKGQYIADVGELRHLECPIGGKYNCLTWPMDLYEFNVGRCFQVVGYLGGYMTRNALLAVDQSKTLSIFVMPDGLGEKVEQHSVVAYDCPDRF
jgi:hypothetical protein